MNHLKRLWPDVAAIVLFLVISFAYFFQPATNHLVLSGHDNTGGVGAGAELLAYAKTHDGPTPRWTGVLFSGMPTYQIAPSYQSINTMLVVQRIYSLGTSGVVMYVFVMLLGFYIMLRAFDFKVWMAALGAILWAFSSYFFIIIGAGHLWKVLTLAFIPPTIAGVVLCYRGRLLVGTAVTGVFTALQVVSNHVQMTYYFLPVMGVVVLSYAIEAHRRKMWRQWCRATACAVVGGLLGVMVNASNLYHTYEYSKHTMRGKSELTAQTQQDAANQTRSGLDRDYITQWSYGIDETWTLLVPDCKGGSSMHTLAESKTAMQEANSQYAPIYQSLPQYWGEQPMTAGPVYVGAFVLLLALLALRVYRTPLMWGLAALTVLSVMLSWGKNMMWFTDLFLDYVPMYDKFRTVSSILVVAEFCLPMMAMLALKKIVDEPEVLRHNLRSLYICFAATGVVALLMAWMPDLFFDSFVSTAERRMLDNAVQAGYIPQQMLGGILANVTEMRQAVLAADCYRTCIVVTIGLLVLLVYNTRRISAPAMVGCVTLLCLADMWMVNKRYLNDAMFQRPANLQAMFEPSATDRQILADSTLNYRVLNLATNTFNENETSFHHKSIGGYHAAKMRRYQEMIERYIAPQMQSLMRTISVNRGVLDSIGQPAADSVAAVLNMLNVRYAIVPLQGGETMPVLNPYAMGNAWFVQDIDHAATPDDEIGHLATVDLRRTAVVGADFTDICQGEMGTGTAQQTLYECDGAAYDVSTERGGLLVISDVYYPGWRAYIDGEEVPVARANYILRAVRVPAGTHKLEMRFDPQSLHVTEGLAYAALALLMLLLVASVVLGVRKK